MALRLVFTSQDRTERYSLSEGENRLGSSPECAIRIPHPSISRQHAMIYVDAGRAEIEDLGSSNGTRLEGRRISGRQPLELGEKLLLGSVWAHLEQVSEKDLEAAVTFGNVEGERIPGPRDAPTATTVGVGSLQRFTLKTMPELLARLTQRGSPANMAQAVGASLFRALPCLEVEVTYANGGGLLFRARRDRADSVEAYEARAENDRITMRVGFLSPRQAHTYAPLVTSGAILIQLAADADGGTESAPIKTQPPPLPDPPTLAPEVLKIYADAGRIARGDVGVLICGESGTGKEVLARYLHAASPRCEKAFVDLNCAALPRDLLESELFGIESGVATGVEPRPGKFEMADGGTLFLDEIGDMALETQARILRVLQEGEVYRLGGQKPRSADVRVIAATLRDLDQMMAEGTFRSDLYHRIADWTVQIPPLRRRRIDIPNLAAYFLDQEARRRGLAVGGISRGAMELLEAYDWPGNVRQLLREMARASLFLEAGDLLESSHLRDAIRSARRQKVESLKEKLETVERTEISQALARHQWNVPSAAKELRLGVSTLYRRMRDLDVEQRD